METRTARKQWQRNAFTNFTGVPRNPRELTGQKTVRRDSRQLRVLGSLSRHTPGRRESLDRATQFEAMKHTHQTAGTKRGAEDHPVFSSAKKAHAIHPPVPQILSQLHVEMEMMSVPEDAMKAQPDVEMGTESVRRGTKRTSSTWED